MSWKRGNAGDRRHGNLKRNRGGGRAGGAGAPKVEALASQQAHQALVDAAEYLARCIKDQRNGAVRRWRAGAGGIRCCLWRIVSSTGCSKKALAVLWSSMCRPRWRDRAVYSEVPLRGPELRRRRGDPGVDRDFGAAEMQRLLCSPGRCALRRRRPRAGGRLSA